MPDSLKKGHSKIRTFAQDFSAQQEKRGTQKIPTATDTKTEPAAKPEAAPVAKAPGATTDQTLPNSKPVEHQPEPEKSPVPKAPIEKTEEPKPQPSQPKSTIPSYHDLQEEVSAIKLHDETKQTEQKEKEFTGKKPIPKNPARANIGYDSTIITDTKGEKFKLFPAIGASLSAWFKALLAPKKKKSPQYSVSEADRRKGVIQKATSQSGSVFTADSSELKEKIRQRQLRQEEAKQAEADAAAHAAHEPETSWSPYTDTGYDLLDEGEPEPEPTTPAPKNVQVQYKQQHTEEANRWHPEEAATEPAKDSVVENEPVPQIIVPKETNVSQPAVEPQEEVAPPEPVTEPAVPEKPKSQSPNPVKTIHPTSPDLAEDEVTVHKGKLFGIDRYSTNTLALAGLALVITIILIVLVVRLIMNTYQTATPEVSTDTSETVAGAQPNNLSVSDSQSLLQQLENGNTIVSEFGFVDTQIYTPTGEVVPPARVMELLQFDVMESFRQSVTDLRFVFLNQSKPILVFSFTDKETIQGGFLAWEKNMFNDLRLIYDLPLNQTTTFTDQTVGDIDVRVLLSQTGQTLIVYGLVNENTALVSNSLADFTQVVETSY